MQIRQCVPQIITDHEPRLKNVLHTKYLFAPYVGFEKRVQGPKSIFANAFYPLVVVFGANLLMCSTKF